MSKYEFDLSVGIQEVLDADSAAKVESQIESQKKRLEEPIELTLSISDAKKRFKELEKETKKVQKSLNKALSSKDFDGISQYTKQMSNIQKEQQELLSIIGEQTKAITGQSNAVKTVEATEKRRKKTVDNITAATEDTIAVIKEQAEAINQVAKAEAKLKRARKTKTSTTKNAVTTQDAIKASEQVTAAQEKASKTKLRTQAQINAELDKELQKLKEIEAQEKRNDAAREELKSAKTDYARVELGVDKAVYDTDKIDSATQSLRAFNTELDKATRSQFPERYKQLCDIITQSFTGQYSISNGLFKDLNDFIGQNADMRELSRLAEQGIKGVATKDINQLFGSVVNSLKSDTSTVKQLLHSGDVVGAAVGKDLDNQEIELNQEMQRLYNERIAQEGKIAALKREELDLIIQQGQEEAKNAAVKIEETTDALGEQSKAFKSTTSSLDELKEKYFSIIKTVETYLELMLKFNNIEGNTWPKFRKNMINFIKDMPQDVIEMLTMDYGDKFTEGLRNSFKGMSSKDLFNMIKSPSWANNMGALELKLNLAKNVDFDNIKYTDDGSIKLLDSDNPFEHLHPQHGIRLIEELYKTLDAIAKITSNHQEQLTTVVEKTADKSEIVAQNAEQLRDAYDKADEKVHSLRDSLAQATDEQERLEQHAKVYGYTLDMSVQKAGRIQSVLSKTGTQFTIARAQAIPNLLKDGYEVDKYSDEYGISVPVSTSYTPITKTEYEYAQYLSSKIAELNVGWEEGLKILASQNGQLDAARQKVAQLEDELSIAEKQAEIAYERMAYASHGVFGDDNIEADKKRLAQSNAQAEANKKLTSSYEGLVEAVEKFHTVNQKAWSAYKNNSPDYQQLAQTRDNAIAEIQNLFPFGAMRNDIPTMLLSSSLKDANIEDVLGFTESKLKNAVNEARTIANGEFVKQNTELIGQFANTGSFKDFEAKFTALSADILEDNIGLEEANKLLQEFADSLLNATKTQVKAEQELSKMILGSSGETLAGAKPINFKYAVMSVEDLVMSHDAYGTVNKNYPSELQPRDRNRMASKTQILSMVKNLLPELLVGSPTAQNGSPIVSDNGIVIGGNARSAALAEAYATGHADGYKAYIAEHASEFGLNASNMPKNPVLVRVVDSDEGLAALAKQLNESTTAGYSTTEQALINEELIMKVISKLNLDESANLNAEANRDFIQSFMGLLPENQRNEMMTKDGSLSAVGLAKTIQALTGAAYGSRDMLENLEQIDQDLKNISNAFISSAAKAADIRHSIESGVLNDLGVISTLLNGVDLLKTARGKHQSIEEYLNQLSLLGSDYAAEDIAIGKFFEANVRNATQLKNMIDTILDFARNAGDPNQLSFGDFENVTLSEVVRGAFAKYAEQYKKKIDYDKLIGEHLPAEVGSRSDKRVDRTDALEAEAQMAPVIEKNTQAKQEQIDAASDVTKQTEAQAEAEEKVAEAANATASALKNVNDVSVEEIVARDVNKALAQLRSATNNETTLFSLKGVFEGDDLIDQAQAMVKNIAEQANLSLGKFNVKDDIIKVQLYNKELQVTVDQMYSLKTATEETGTAQLQLMSQSFSQNVKALNENNFDVEGVQQRALASIEKVRSSLHGLAYDLTDLETVAKNISSQDDFNKFNNQLKATQDNIQAIKNSTVSKSSMNPLANMQRDMQNANIEIETMHLKLEKLGDIQGVAKAKQMLKDMTDATQEFNKAQDAQGQQAAYNNYSNLRSSFNAQMEYINVAKQLNASQQEAQKIATEAYKYQFQNQYKYTGGKTAADQNVLDSMSDYYKKEEQEAQQFNNNIKGIYDQLMSTLKQMGTVDTKMSQVLMQDKGSGLYSTVLSGLQTEKSALIADVRSFEGELQSVLNLPQGTSGLGAIFTDARVQTALTKDEIQKLDDALKNLDNIQFNFAAKLSQQIQPVIEKVQLLKQMIADGFISQDSDIAKNILNIDSTIANKNNNYKETGSAAAAQDLMQYTNNVNEYVSALEKAAQAEQKYFAGKQQYTAGTGQTFENVNNTASSTAKSYNDLTEAVRNYTKEYQLGEPYITKFTQSANGISKIEFSTFDKGTGAVRKFNMEMGNISQKMYATETTVSKSMANIQAAFNQIDKINVLKEKLSASGIDFSGSGASTQVQELFGKYQALSNELAKGDKADQTKITQLTQDCKLAVPEVEKLYKQMMQMNSAIENGSARALDGINPKGDIYGQLTQSLQKHVAQFGDGTLEFGRFDKATNTLNATLTHTNGTVEHLKASMYGLNGECAVQQTGVGKLTTSWDRFKSSISQTGKQLMTALVGYNVFYKAMSEVRKGIGYVKEIDLALTELKKVTDETEESYRKFLNTAAGTAGEIGSTVSDFTEATANFARLGYTMDESADMAKTAIVYKNVADGLDTVDEATDSIISTMKAFGIESDNTMQIIDIFNEVGNNFAITSAGIGEAMQRSASALYEAGNSIQESTGLITAANSVIQNPEQVGEMLADYKVA